MLFILLWGIEIFLTCVLMLIVLALWTGASFLASNWGYLLTIMVWYAYIPIMISLFLFFVSNEEKWFKGYKTSEKVLLWISSCLAPYACLLYLKKSVIDKYPYYNASDFPIKGKVMAWMLTALLLLTLVSVIVGLVLKRVGVYVMPLIWLMVYVFILPGQKDPLLEKIASNEVIKPISYTYKGRELEATGDDYHKSTIPGDITVDMVGVVINGERKQIKKKNVKVGRFISRRDLLIEQGKEIGSLVMSSEESVNNDITNARQMDIVSSSAQFSDGVVWVKDKNTGYYLVDIDGEVLFRKDKINTYPTPYYNDVAIVDDCLLNKKGEIVWALEREGYEYGKEKWGDAVDEMKIVLADPERFFGNFYVHYHIESYQLTSDYLGMVGKDGKWIFEPIQGYYDACSYGMVTDYISPRDPIHASEIVVNILTGEMSVAENSYDKEVVRRWENAYHAQIHNGMFYSYEEGFVDIDGNLLVNLRDYPCILNNPDYVDGYTILDIENSGGSMYYTVIDIEGKQMFTPKPYEDHSEIKCGVYRIADKLYNIHGEQILDYAEYGVKNTDGYGDFNEGRARIVTSGMGIHFINTEGDIVF